MSGICGFIVRKTGLFISALGLSLGVAGAHAANVGFTLVISGSNNVPTFNLTNDSDTALLSNFTFTIGNTAKNFDHVGIENVPAGGTFVVISPDANLSGGLRTDVLDLDFTGFDPAEFAQWESDVDPDNSNVTENYELVFFNNGGLPNSVATATFSDGTVLALTLDDRDTSLSSHSFVASGTSVVPIPAAAWLFGSALVGLMGMARRAKQG